MPHIYETFSVGNSREGRPMPVHVFKSTGKELFRVFFYAQVHGIENEAGEAANLLINDIKLNPGGYYDNVTIAVMPHCNVDGFFHQTYTTPIGWDMDIDSLARFTPECRNLFGFVKLFKPQITVDGHTLNRHFANILYPNERNLARADDFVITKLETQIARKDITWKQNKEIHKELNTLYPQYVWDEYWHIYDAEPYDGTRARSAYYTPDIALIYQFMSSRYNTIGFLTEGISPYDLTDPDEFAERAEIARRSNYLFLKYLIDYGKKHPELVNPKVCPIPQGTEIPVRWEPIMEKQQYQTFNIEDRDTREPRHYVSDEFTRYYTPTDFVTIPLGYAYPNTETYALLSWYLGPQYDFKTSVGTTTDRYDIETIHIINAEEGERHDDPVTVHKAWQGAPINVSTTNVDSTMTNFSNMVIVLCDQEGGHMLPQLLEPTSEYALTRYYEEVGLLVLPDTDYVVKRLIKKIA